MKPWIILIGLSVASMAAATVALPYVTDSSKVRGPVHPAPSKPDGPAPTLVIDEDLEYKFGILPQFYHGKHAWLFKNTGAGPLELRGSSVTCSCTTADLFEGKTGKTAQLQPGESRSILVTFETKTFDHFHQTVTIATNDPQKPEVRLVVDGTVRPAIVTVPGDPSINFLAVSNEDPTTRRFFLYSPDRPDIKLERLVSANPALIGIESRPATPEELANLKAEKAYAIEVTVKPSPVLGEFAQEMLIETDHPMKKELRFRVKGTVTGPIACLPEKVTMRSATSSDGGSETLTLVARGRTSVNFTVEKKPEGMDVKLEPLPVAAGVKSSKYKMTVTLSPGIQSGLIGGEVVLKTDDPSVKEFRVPVQVLVLGAR